MKCSTKEIISAFTFSACVCACQGNAVPATSTATQEVAKSVPQNRREPERSAAAIPQKPQPQASSSAPGVNAVISCQPMHFATSTTATKPWIRVSTGKSPVPALVKTALLDLQSKAALAKWPSGEAVSAAAAVVELKPANANSEEHFISVEVNPAAPLGGGWHRLSFAGPVPAGFRLLGNCHVFEDGSFGAVFHPDYMPVAQRLRVCQKAGGSRKVTLHLSERVALPGNTAVGSLTVTVAGKVLACDNLSLLSDHPPKDNSQPTTDEVSLTCPTWPNADVVTVSVPVPLSAAAGGVVTAPPGVATLTAKGSLAQLQQVEQGCWELPFSP